ncbi:MAG: hypothetical protein J6D57_07685 [Mogibacterium sp.]|nr:hypothetical protein [Mogibacterium sp.]
MKKRFNSKTQILDIVFTTLGAMLSVGTMLYGVSRLGLSETWPELVLNLFYIACVVMIVMYFFGRLDSRRFNYWSSVCIGITVLLRDILFPPPLENYPIRLICFTLSVLLLLMLTYFYARKDWQTYTKRNLWLLLVVDTLIAGLYNIVLLMSPVNDYTGYLMTEIWIRPTIIYGLVVCFVSGDEITEQERKKKENKEKK